MIAFLLFCTVILLAILEHVSRRDDLRHLHVVFETDSTLLEPGEISTLRYTVYNTSPWPLLFAGLTLRLEPEVELAEDDEWTRLHAVRDFTGTRIDHHFYLLPYRRFSGRLRFRLHRRGLQELGHYYLQFGDFLGLRPVMRTGDLARQVICTSSSEDLGALDVPGGELGDMSVRRFILDDPTMLLGYREYTGREPMKQISWMQSAKAGRLMVRQNDYTTDRVAVVLVNMDSSRREPMERCLTLVRSVCETLEKAGIPYSLLSNGDLFTLSEGLGKSHLFFILRRIGLSRLTGFLPFSDLVESCVRRRRSNCSYIVITPSLGDAEEAALARLRRFADRDPIVLYGGGSTS